MSKVPRYIAIKYMCQILYKRSKECNVKDVGDALLHAACSLQNICRFPSVRLIIFQLILSNVKDVGDNTKNDNRLHCIALSLFYFMSKMSEMCTMTMNYNVNSKSKYSN